MITIAKSLLASALLVALSTSSPLLAQMEHHHAPAASTPASAIEISVYNETAPAMVLKAADLAKLQRKTVKALDHGKEGTFEGVPLIEVLKLAGVPTGEKIHGPELALYLVAEARDGYRAVFALPELDPRYNDRDILLTDMQDGQALSAEMGPLRIVVVGEKHAARWVRQVSALRVLRAPVVDVAKVASACGDSAMECGPSH